MHSHGPPLEIRRVSPSPRLDMPIGNRKVPRSVTVCQKPKGRVSRHLRARTARDENPVQSENATECALPRVQNLSRRNSTQSRIGGFSFVTAPRSAVLQHCFQFRL